MTDALKVEPTVKQLIAWQEAQRADVVLLAGSFGSAKTATVCMWGIQEMLKQPHQCLILRSTYQELDDTMRPEFETWCPESAMKGKIPKSPPYNCEFKNGGRFMFRHVEKGIYDLKGITAGSVIIDQVEEMDQDTFFFILGRLRGEGPRKVMMTMNCNGHDWLWRMFRQGADIIHAPKMHKFDDEEREFIVEGGVYRKKIEVMLPDGETLEVNASLVEITALENPHLPKDFLAR